MANLTKFEQLVAFLNENKFPHKVDVAQQVVELPSNAAPLPGNLYVKWEKTVPFLQVIHFMIEDVPEDRVRELETAIVRLNNLLEVGGFGFDHATRRLYCRLTAPAFPNDGIDPVTLNQLGTGCVRNAREFYDALRAVVDGMPGDQIADAYTKLVQSRARAT